LISHGSSLYANAGVAVTSFLATAMYSAWVFARDGDARPQVEAQQQSAVVWASGEVTGSVQAQIDATVTAGRDIRVSYLTAATGHVTADAGGAVEGTKWALAGKNLWGAGRGGGGGGRLPRHPRRGAGRAP